MGYQDTHIDESDADRINALFVGRRVVDVKTEDILGEWRSRKEKVGLLTLDDGSTLKIVPNAGCGGCPAGWYYLEGLKACENVITRAEVVEDELEPSDDNDWNTRRYTLFVFADNEMVNLATVEGDDGNGYYGTGFEIVVEEASGR